MKKIFYNGNIITMEKNINVEAVLIEGDKIIEIGNFSDISNKYSEAEKIDLMGKTLMPSFIDAHSHFSGTATALLQISLEEANSIKEILEKINSFIKDSNLEKNKWIVARGYDHNQLKEKKHPTCEDLDKITIEFPIVIQHKSGHVGVFNSKALELLGVNIKEKESLTGYMEENEFIDCLQKISLPNSKDIFNAFFKAQEKYLSNGITTVQDGMMVDKMIPLYDGIIKSKFLKLDLVGYVDREADISFFNSFKDSKMKYKDNFKIGGYKIFLDGSPQAKTAWMLNPYLGEEEYSGYGTMKYEDVCDGIRKATINNMQILAHCNGDAATKQFIDAIRKIKDEGYDIEKLRPVMIHAQLLPLDQIGEVKELGIIPSFFVAHVYHWGDVHIKNFGFERAANISPAKSALENNITFTFHQDSPIIEPNMIETIYCATNRITKSGVVLGDNQKIEVMEALKAVTINAAYQYFEEDKKGSIKVGKNADFVILDKNPLEIPIKEINSITVLETIKDGITLFKK